MGRRRLPDNVAALRGIPRPPVKHTDPLPATPRPPKWVRGEGLKEWRRVCPALFKLGRLADVDQACLAIYCRWYAHLVEIDKQLTESTYLVAGQKSDDKTNPLWRAWRDATKEVVALQRQLGLTPDSRLRASSIPIEEDEIDELESILTAPTR